jgi:hypothetical protein
MQVTTFRIVATNPAGTSITILRSQILPQPEPICGRFRQWQALWQQYRERQRQRSDEQKPSLIHQV